ncbi:hypothetical protein [Streptomyces sp. NPDC093089]
MSELLASCAAARALSTPPRPQPEEGDQATPPGPPVVRGEAA